MVGSELLRQRKLLHQPPENPEGSAHPDRDAQFEHINWRIKQQFQAAGQAAISRSDTKRLNWLGDSRMAERNSLSENLSLCGYTPRRARQGCSTVSRADAGQPGWVNVGIHHDTAASAVESIPRWWNALLIAIRALLVC
jgi:hypothetical protein